MPNVNRQFKNSLTFFNAVFVYAYTNDAVWKRKFFFGQILVFTTVTSNSPNFPLYGSSHSGFDHRSTVITSDSRLCARTRDMPTNLLLKTQQLLPPIPSVQPKPQENSKIPQHVAKHRHLWIIERTKDYALVWSQVLCQGNYGNSVGGVLKI